MQAMEQNPKNLDHLAARMAQRLAADPNHPAAQRMRADLARLARARKLEEAESEEKPDGVGAGERDHAAPSSEPSS